MYPEVNIHHNSIQGIRHQGDAHLELYHIIIWKLAQLCRHQNFPFHLKYAFSENFIYAYNQIWLYTIPTPLLFTDFPYYIPFQLCCCCCFTFKWICYIQLVLHICVGWSPGAWENYQWPHPPPQDSPSHGSHHIGVGSGELVPHSWRMVTALILCQSLLV